MHNVAFKRCISYEPAEVDGAVKDAVGLIGGMETYVSPGMEVLIKPNMLMARPPERAVTTHPEVLRAVLRLVKEAGGKPSVGDSQAIGSFKKICETTGIGAVAREEGAKLVELSETVEVEGAGGTFKKLTLSKAAMEADAVINLPKAKTHAQMLLTLAVKNMFGCVPGKRKPQWHLRCGVDRHAFADMLVGVCKTVSPVLNIADAVVGMEGNGPGSGRPVGIGYIAASGDAFALDTALAHIMGVDGNRLPTTRAARRLGLLEDKTSIAPLGDVQDLDGARLDGFRLPSASNLEWSVPEPVRRFLKDAFTTKPDVNADRCVLCGMCVGTCPAGAMKDSSGEVRIDLRRCIRCYCCQEICPEGAIGVKEGWLLRVLG